MEKAERGGKQQQTSCCWAKWITVKWEQRPRLVRCIPFQWERGAVGYVGAVTASVREPLLLLQLLPGHFLWHWDEGQGLTGQVQHPQELLCLCSSVHWAARSCFEVCIKVVLCSSHYKPQLLTLPWNNMTDSKSLLQQVIFQLPYGFHAVLVPISNPTWDHGTLLMLKSPNTKGRWTDMKPNSQPGFPYSFQHLYPQAKKQTNTFLHTGLNL